MKQGECMIQRETAFTFKVIQEHPNSQKALITVPANYIDSVYNHVVLTQKAKADTYGFSQGTTPLYYIEQNFRPNIIEHLKELFFTHCVTNYLYSSLDKNKIVTIGDPMLLDVKLEPHSEAQYLFGLNPVVVDNAERWRKLSVRAPERKNYKDLDRQVEFFMKEETDKAAEGNHDRISINDWVCFELTLYDNNANPLLKNYKDQLWIKVSDEEADGELQSLFVGKKVGDQFLTTTIFLQNYMSYGFDMNYTFHINILDIIPNNFFSFDHLKRHFNIKSQKDMHLKLIEVFSYRNDISQRRETIEVTLKLLLKHYFIPISTNMLERQKKSVLSAVHNNPDYHVYKSQNDFKEKIKLLAEKQLKETILIDMISFQENISVSHDEILGYINFIKRPRTKEFLYFELPDTKFMGQEIPLSTSQLKKHCIREKTLNHVINHLTKKI